MEFGPDGQLGVRWYGVSVRADAEGIVQVPFCAADSTGRRQQLVVSRHNDLFGHTSMEAGILPPGGVWKLRLEPEIDLQAVVVDASGTPLQGVPLAVSAASTEAPEQQRSYLRLVGETDARGLLRIGNLRERLMGRTVEAKDRFRVVLHLPGLDHVGIDLDLHDLPQEPVHLTMPATGSIRVLVQDEDGQPLRGVTSVSASLIEPPTPSRVTWIEVPTSGDDPARGTLIRYVPPGLRFHVDARALPVGPQRQKVDGPRIADQTVDVVLRLAPGLVTLRGRALDAMLQPIANARLRLKGESDDRDGSIDQETRSFDDGCFEFRLPASMNGRALTRTRLEQLDVDWLSYGRRAEFPHGPFQAGVNEVGDVVLLPPALIVSGRVIASDPVYPRGVILGITTPGEGRGPTDTSRWVKISDQMFVLREDGTFEIRGEAPPTPLRLNAVDFWSFLPIAPIPFVAGTTNLEVRLERGGAVDLVVNTGAVEAWWGLQAMLLPIDGVDRAVMVPRGIGGYGDRAFAELQSLYSEGGHNRVECTWPCLWPGRYRLEIGAHGMPPVHTVAEVKVRAGETTRLPEINLQKAFRILTITLVGADGAPLTERQTNDGHVRVLGAENHPEDVFGIDQLSDEATASVLSTRPTVDLEVVVPGHRMQRIYGVRQSRTVQLEPGLPVRLEVEGLEELPLGVTSEVWLEPAFVAQNGASVSMLKGGRDHVSRVLVEAQLEGNGAVNFAVVGPGRHLVSMTLMRGGRFEEIGPSPYEIDVQEADRADDVQVFRIVVPAEERKRVLPRFAR